MEQPPDPIPFIVPTRGKSPVWKGWKYPIGAEIVTRGLEGCPRRGEVELGFSCYRVSRADVDKPLIVLYAEYRYAQGWIGGGDWPVSWCITVKAVPSEIAHRVRELLIADGLPQTSAWLSLKRTQTWLDKRHRLDFEFDVEGDQLRTVEGE